MGKGSCGRSACSLAPKQIQENVGWKISNWENQQKYRPRYNAPPNTYQPVICMVNGEHKIITMRWGLVPSFWEEPVMRDLKTINARSDNLTNNMWKRLLPHNRCVLIADGYFEWRQQGPSKQPYFIHFENGKLMKMAALYDCWKKGEEELYTYTIVTTDAAPEITFIHNRMPFIFTSDEDAQMWIDCDNYPPEKVLPLLKKVTPVAGERPKVKSESKTLEGNVIEYYRVPDVVNNIRNNTPDCIKPLDEFKMSGIAKFFTKKEKKEELPVKDEPIDDFPLSEDYALDDNEEEPTLHDDGVSVEEKRSQVDIKKKRSADDEKQTVKKAKIKTEQ